MTFSVNLGDYNNRNPNNDPSVRPPAVGSSNSNNQQKSQKELDYEDMLSRGYYDMLPPYDFSLDGEENSGEASGSGEGSGAGEASGSGQASGSGASSGSNDGDAFGRQQGQNSPLFDVGRFSVHFTGVPPQNKKKSYKLLYDFRKANGSNDPRDLDTFIQEEEIKGYNVFDKLAQEMAQQRINDEDNDFIRLEGVNLKEGSPQHSRFINEKFANEYQKKFNVKPGTHNNMEDYYKELYHLLEVGYNEPLANFDAWYAGAKHVIGDPVKEYINKWKDVHTHGLNIFAPLNDEDIKPEFKKEIEDIRKQSPLYYLGLKDNHFHFEDTSTTNKDFLRESGVPNSVIDQIDSLDDRDEGRKVVEFINNARNNDPQMDYELDKMFKRCYDPSKGLTSVLQERMAGIYILKKQGKIPAVPYFDLDTADGMINMILYSFFNTKRNSPNARSYTLNGEIKKWYDDWKGERDLARDVGYHFKDKYYERYISHKPERPYTHRTYQLPNNVGSTGGRENPNQPIAPKPGSGIPPTTTTGQPSTTTGQPSTTTGQPSTTTPAQPSTTTPSPQDDDTRTGNESEDEDDEPVRPPRVVPSSTRAPPARPTNPTNAGRYYVPHSGEYDLPQGYFSIEVLPQGRFNIDDGEDFVGETSASGIEIDRSIFRDMNPQSEYVRTSNAGRDRNYYNPNWERDLRSASQTFVDEADVDNSFFDEVSNGLLRDMKEKVDDPSNPYYDVDVLASQSAYAPAGQRVTDINGYKYNPAYSDQFIAVYEKDDVAVIAFKGTDTVFEHMSNFMDITSGEVMESAQFKNMLNVARVYVYNHLDSKKMIRTVGHSRGGTASFYTSAVLAMEFYNKDITIEGSGFAVGGFYPGVTKILSKGVLGGDRNTAKSAGITKLINFAVEKLGLQRHIALEAIMPSKLGWAISGFSFLKDQIINNEDIATIPVSVDKYPVIDRDGRDTGLYTASNKWRISQLVDWVGENFFGIKRDLILKADQEVLEKMKKELQTSGEEQIKKMRADFNNKFPFASEFTLPKYIGANIMGRAVIAGYRQVSREVDEEADNARQNIYDIFRETDYTPEIIAERVQAGETLREILEDFEQAVTNALAPGLSPEMDALRARNARIKFVDELLKIYSFAFKIKYLLNNFFNSEMQAVDKLINADITGEGQPDFTRRFRSYGVMHNPNTYTFEDSLDVAGYTDIVSGFTKNKIKSFTGRQAELTTQHTFPVTAPAEVVTGSGVPMPILAAHNLLNYIKPEYRTPQQMQEIVRALRNLKYRRISEMGVPFTRRGRQEAGYLFQGDLNNVVFE